MSRCGESIGRKVKRSRLKVIIAQRPAASFGLRQILRNEFEQAKLDGCTFKQSVGSSEVVVFSRMRRRTPRILMTSFSKIDDDSVEKIKEN